MAEPVDDLPDPSPDASPDPSREPSRDASPDAAPLHPFAAGRLDPTADAVEQSLLGRPASLGRREVSRGAGVSVRSARRFWHALGFPLVGEGDAMFTEADLEALRRVAELVRRGDAEEDFALAMTRALARTMDRLASWQTQLVLEEVTREAGEAAGAGRSGDKSGEGGEGGESDLGDVVGPGADIEEGGDLVRETAARLTDFAEDLEPLLVYVWRRQLSAAINRMITTVGLDETVSGQPLVIGFADLVSFTSVVRRLDERELARMVQRFEDLCTDIVTAHGGRVVKTAGDEVMFSTPLAAPAAAIALDLVEAMATDDLLPDARVGMAYGDVVHRLGDLFGTTVNRASRLTAAAPSSGVFVDDALARLLAPLSGFSTSPTRRRTLRGLGEVVPSRLVRVTGVRGPAPLRHP